MFSNQKTGAAINFKVLIIFKLIFCASLFIVFPGQTYAINDVKDSMLLNSSGKLTPEFYFDLGKKYFKVKADSMALYNYQIALKEYEKQKNEKQTAFVLKAIGKTYLNHLMQYEIALEYFQMSLEIFNDFNDSLNIASLNNYIGICYHSLAQHDKAYKYYLKSYNLGLALKDTLSLKIAINNLGELLYLNKKYDEAFEYFKKTNEINKNDSWGSAYININIAKYYIKIQQYDTALMYLSLSETIAKKNSYKELIRICYYTYTTIYSLQNNVELLEKYNNLYLQISDSLYNDKSLEMLTEMQAKYETKEKIRENQLLKAEKKVQNQRIIALSIGLFILLVFFVVFFIQYQKQLKSNKALVRKNLEIVEREKELQIAKDQLENNIKEIRDNNINNNEGDSKYTSSKLPEEQKDQLSKMIVELMQKEKPYLEADFTLQKMADMVNSSRTYVSQVINEYFNCNFNVFINDYRIKEARRRLSDPGNKNITIEGIAYEVGFKSKSAFNTAFKKFSGVPPSFYLKSIQ